MTLPLYSVPDVYAVLRCGHSLLWSDPDEDVNGSHYCGRCGLWVGIESFR